jgi:hypothetical protein
VGEKQKKSDQVWSEHKTNWWRSLNRATIVLILTHNEGIKNVARNFPPFDLPALRLAERGKCDSKERGESSKYLKKHKYLSEKPLHDLLDFSPAIKFFGFAALI